MHGPVKHTIVHSPKIYHIGAGVSIFGSSPCNLLPHPICPNGFHAGASGQGDKSEGDNIPNIKIHNGYHVSQYIQCYRNFGCSRPWGIFEDVNHIISNLGYIVYGAAFILMVEFETASIVPKNH